MKINTISARTIVFLCLLCIALIGCSPSYEEPKISLEDYKLEKGFELQMLAAEPLIKSPVAMDFDSQGRIWVVEMPGYMSTIDGKDEQEPTGAIRILEDFDDDGVMDHSKVFLDSLVMPRALAHVYGGLLYAEPPNLWFVEIDDDRPGKRTLVDSLYAPDGNPEHQSNGLVLNLDNWIYSAKHNQRYQRKNGEWHKSPTTIRGQWGITHDNFGRLYYNDNARQLLGDYALPDRLIRNTFFEPKRAINRLLTDDQRVYPLHAASVNRGYAPGVLDNDSLLKEVTSASGPLIYRGGTFPDGYDQNAFISIPEGNLIKRNLLTFHGDSISAEQAWQEKEFLASTDEGFRPVNLYNGPDGALYIVDMHIGVIQHYAFLSPYLKKVAQQKQLDTLTGLGRILRIKSKDAEHSKMPDFDNLSGRELVKLLKHKNGWIRDRAQHYLVFKDKKDALPELENLVKTTDNPLAQIHALYTLEGWNALSFEMLTSVAQQSKPDVVAHAIVLLEDFASKENVGEALVLFQDLHTKNDKSIDLYLASTVGIWTKVSKREFVPLVATLFETYKDNSIISEALLSGMGDTSESLYANLQQHPDFEDSALHKIMAQSIERRKEDNLNPIFTDAEVAMDNRTNGAKLFRQICAACHGTNGSGADGVAPPLMNSEYVADSPEKLGLIILHGLSGPVHVNGQRYEFNQAMPGLNQNPNLSNEDISDIITYVTNAFSRAPRWIKPETIGKLRNAKSENGGEYTEPELQAYSE
ncbi:MAG: PVC-type heme-binding CxxCH protein [Pricia sp.]